MLIVQGFDKDGWTYVNTLEKEVERLCTFFDFFIPLLLRGYVTNSTMTAPYLRFESS